MTCAQLQTKTWTSISREKKLCNAAISNSLGSRTVSFTIFKEIFAYAIEFYSIYFSEHGTVIHDISKQIEQRTRIGEIFARWQLGFIWEISARFPRWGKVKDPGDEFWHQIREQSKHGEIQKF